ncbi:hypothetical protein FRC02_011445 [Tulasnella sp. 418]|nr:hypothetical protein FRC02_011445 [Tulasnella sp. 418]
MAKEDTLSLSCPVSGCPHNRDSYRRDDVVKRHLEDHHGAPKIRQRRYKREPTDDKEYAERVQSIIDRVLKDHDSEYFTSKGYMLSFEVMEELEARHISSPGPVLNHSDSEDEAEINALISIEHIEDSSAAEPMDWQQDRIDDNSMDTSHSNPSEDSTLPTGPTYGDVEYSWPDLPPPLPDHTLPASHPITNLGSHPSQLLNSHVPTSPHAMILQPSDTPAVPSSLSNQVQHYVAQPTTRLGLEQMCLPAAFCGIKDCQSCKQPKTREELELFHIPDHSAIDVEGRIIQDSDRLITEAPLANANVTLHPRYKLLICLHCGGGVRPKHIETHMHNHGLTITISIRNDLKMFLRENCHSMPCQNGEKGSDIPPSPKPNTDGQWPFPVAGLQLNRSGLACTRCAYLTGSKNSFDSHWSKIHSRQGCGKKSYERCSIQTFFLSCDRRRYFRVHDVTTTYENTTKGRVLAALNRKVAKDRQLAPRYQALESEQLVHPVFSVIGWLQVIRGMEKDTIDVYTSLIVPGHSYLNMFNWLRLHAESYVDQVFSELESFNRSWLARMVRGASKGSRPLKRFQTEATQKVYCRIWCQFTLFVLRTAQIQDPAILQYLSLSEESRSISRRIMAAYRSKASSCLVINLLHQLFDSLFLRPLASSSDKANHPAPLFATLSNYEGGTRFREPKHITGMLTIFLFAIRITVSHAIILKGQNGGQSLREAKEELICYVQPDTPETVFSHFWAIYKPVYSEARHRNDRPRFFSSATDPDAFEFDGNPFRYSWIQHMGQALLGKAERCFIEACAEIGLTEADLPSLGLIRETLSDATPKYSFLNDPRNNPNRFQEFEDQVFNRLAITDKYLKGVGENGELLWNLVEVRKLQAIIEKLLRLIMAADLLTNGPSPRGSSLKATLIQNSGGRLRNISVADNIVMHFSTYSKTSASKGTDATGVRGYSLRLGYLVMMYTIVFKGLDVLLSTIDASADGDVRQMTYDNLYFVNQSHIEVGELSDEVADCCFEYTGVRKGIRGMRQIMEYVKHQRISPHPRMHSFVDVLMEHQAGHTPEIGDISYARDERSRPSFTKIDIQACLAVSTIYHQWFGIQGGLPCNIDTRMHGNIPLPRWRHECPVAMRTRNQHDEHSEMADVDEEDIDELEEDDSDIAEEPEELDAEEGARFISQIDEDDASLMAKEVDELEDGSDIADEQNEPEELSPEDDPMLLSQIDEDDSFLVAKEVAQDQGAQLDENVGPQEVTQDQGAQLDENVGPQEVTQDQGAQLDEDIGPQALRMVSHGDNSSPQSQKDDHLATYPNGDNVTLHSPHKVSWGGDTFKFFRVLAVEEGAPGRFVCGYPHEDKGGQKSGQPYKAKTRGELPRHIKSAHAPGSQVPSKRKRNKLD